MAEKIGIKIILGSIRSNRFGQKPANWVLDELKKRDDVDVELLDLLDYPMPMFDSPTSPSMMGMKYPNPIVQKWSDKINGADAYVMVTPEYNHGYPASLKNALDWLSPEWSRKVVGFVGYGSASGARSIEQLRQVVIELNMVPIKRSIHIPFDFIMKASADKSIDNAELFAPLRTGMGSDFLAMFIDDLVWTAKALKNARGSAAGL